MEAQLERLLSARRAIDIIKDIINDLDYQPPPREAYLEPSPGIPPVALIEDEVERSDSPPLPILINDPPLITEECPICLETTKEVILNCQGRRSFCGKCPSALPTPIGLVYILHCPNHDGPQSSWNMVDFGKEYLRAAAGRITSQNTSQSYPTYGARLPGWEETDTHHIEHKSNTLLEVIHNNNSYL